MKTKLSRLLAAGGVLAGLGCAAAQAQSVEQFYKDKQIRMIVSADAGTDYDIWARLITRHMGRHIPGAPSFVTQNMPGGGQITATNHLFNVAARDGSVIGMIGRNLPNQALAKHASVKFDPVKFNWLGSPELTNRVCVALDSSGVKTGEDLLGKELIVGGAGAGTAVSMTPTLLKNMLGMKFKLVEGYKSAGDVILAMERGEVQGICQTITAIEKSRPGWMAQGKLHVLFNMERDVIPDVKAPTIYKYVKTEEQKQLLGLFSTSVELGRPVVAPPDVPADRVAALRQAFDAAMKDNGFLKEAQSLDLEINPRTGKELEQMVVDLMRTPPDLSEKLSDLIAR